MEDLTENPIEEQDQEEKKFTDTHLVRVISILFVLFVYLVIFMKILFLD
jgi:hypothetical protein